MFTESGEKTFLFAGAIFIVICCLCFLCLMFFLAFQAKPSPTPTFPTVRPTPTPVYAYPVIYRNFLPVIVKAEEEKNLSLYRLDGIEKRAYALRGLRYDVGFFTNIEDESISLLAHCMQPNNAIPEIGSRFRLNEWGVLTPIDEPIFNSIQRFNLIRFLGK